MKIYDLQHIVESIYQRNFSLNFNVNTVLNTRFSKLYINDPLHLSKVKEYEDKGYEVINRFNDPYELIELPIKPLFDIPSELPVCLENAHLMKYMYSNDILYVHFPDRGMGFEYEGKPTYLGLINYNINYVSKKFEFK